MHNGKVNKTRYDDPGKSMKKTSFIVKNLGGNLPKMQFIILKSSEVLKRYKVFVVSSSTRI